MKYSVFYSVATQSLNEILKRHFFVYIFNLRVFKKSKLLCEKVYLFQTFRYFLINGIYRIAFFFVLNEFYKVKIYIMFLIKNVFILVKTSIIVYVV